ncbi:MAG: MFS transporter [Nocardioidaceae bacterium]
MNVGNAWTTLPLTAERPRPAWVREHSEAWLFAVGTVCFGAFMGQLDASVVTLTFRSLSSDFHASLAAVQWVSLAYLVTLAAILIPVGRLSDAHGRKLFYLYGFATFTLASVACGLAWSVASLVAFRVVQAVGAALLQANSVALVVTSTPSSSRRKALGMQAGAQALGLALGPTVGGVLVSTLGWRWVFALNAPVGVAGIVAGHFLLPRTRSRHRVASLDWPGVLALAGTLTGALLALSVMSGMGWPLWCAGALVVAAGLALWLLRVRQVRAPEPLLPASVLRAPGVVPGVIGALAGYLVLFGPLVLVPVVLGAHGYSALHAGLVLTALPTGFAVAAVIGERVLPAGWSSEVRCRVGAAVCVAACAAIAADPVAIASLVPALALLGLGLGIFTPANNALVMGAVPTAATGTGGGLLNTTRGLGTALGVALVTLALQAELPEGSTTGARAAAAVLLAFAALAFATVRRAPRRAGTG